MKHAKPVLRWLGRRGGVVVFALLCAEYLASRYYSVDIALTHDEHIGLIGGMCSVTWRTALHPDPRVWADCPFFTVNRMDIDIWLSSFSGGTVLDHRYIWFPIWVFIIAAAAWMVAGLAWPRPRVLGQCRKCGYDMTGLPMSSACPECGVRS